jgi:hypothetical protein
MISVDSFHTPGSHGSTASIPSHHPLTLFMTCYLSDWSHPTQPKPHPCDAEAGKRCPRASKLPETHHHRTKRNRHPTTGISVPHIFLIDLRSIARKLAFLSAPCLVWNPEPSRTGPPFLVCSHDSKAPPGTNETTHAAGRVAVCCHLASIRVGRSSLSAFVGR